MVQEGATTASADRTYVHGGRVDEIVASQVNGTWYNHHYDAQGNCILVSTASGGIQEQYDYDAFGFPYFYTPSEGMPGNVKTRFLFAEREWISDLRIYDYRARQYQPELGRFLQPDPKQFAAGHYNLYRYCHNDPVNKSDPTGLETLTRPEIDDRVADTIVAIAQHLCDNRELYIGAAIAAAEAWRSHGFVSGSRSPLMRGLLRSETGYRYVSRAEAKIISKDRHIPKTDPDGKPKPVFFTNERFDSASAAQKALSLSTTPEFRVEFALSDAPAG